MKMNELREQQKQTKSVHMTEKCKKKKTKRSELVKFGRSDYKVSTAKLIT